MRASLLITCVVLLDAVALAAPSRLAIAPIPVGEGAQPALVRAFEEELSPALSAAGFQVVPPNEVDLKVGERPEFIKCTSGGCLAEEAAFLRVRQLILPRVDTAADGLRVALSLYDAGEKQSVADAVVRCAAPCSAPTLRSTVREAAAQLHANSVKPGTVEVRATPAASLRVDGKPVGSTPWRGALPPGDHVVTFESGSARVERDVAVVPGRTAKIDVTLEVPALPPAKTAHPRTRFRVVKWVLLAGGLALGGAGAGLWAIDGRGTCTPATGQLECPKVYDTIGVGATLVGLGGAFLLTSVLMLALDKPLPPVQVGVSASEHGAALAATGRF